MEIIDGNAGMFGGVCCCAVAVHSVDSPAFDKSFVLQIFQFKGHLRSCRRHCFSLTFSMSRDYVVPLLVASHEIDLCHFLLQSTIAQCRFSSAQAQTLSTALICEQMFQVHHEGRERPIRVFLSMRQHLVFVPQHDNCQHEGFCWEREQRHSGTGTRHFGR